MTTCEHEWEYWRDKETDQLDFRRCSLCSRMEKPDVKIGNPATAQK